MKQDSRGQGVERKIIYYLNRSLEPLNPGPLGPFLSTKLKRNNKWKRQRKLKAAEVKRRSR